MSVPEHFFSTLPLTHKTLVTFYGCAKTGIFLAVGQEGDVTIFTTDAIILKELQLNSAAGNLALLATERWIAYTTPHELIVCTYEKKTCYTEEGVFNGCLFVQEASLFWAVKKISETHVLVKCFQYQTWEVLAQAEIEDLYGGSSFIIKRGAAPHSITLWMAGGQDGQSSLFLTYDQGRIMVDFFEKEDTCPPEFNPAGTEFAVSDDEALYRYAYPDKRLLQTIVYPEDFFYQYSMCYLDETHLLILGENGLHQVDTHSTQMELVQLDGHESKPASYYFPMLTDREQVTDIYSAEQFGDYILLGCSNDRTAPYQTKYSVLILKTKFLMSAQAASN